MPASAAAVQPERGGTEALARPIGALANVLLGSRGCLFNMHRAAPSTAWDALPNRSFYLDLDFVDRMLTHLKQAGWAVVTIEEALRRVAVGGDAGRFVNISVDDCYRDTWEHVVPLFRRHGVPVTLFVTTGIPDGTLPLWAAGLEAVLVRSSRVVLPDGVADVPTAEAKRAAFDRISAGWDGPGAGACYAEFCRLNGEDPAALDREHAITWEMLQDLSRDPLVEIGAHTVSHPHVSDLAPDQAMVELVHSNDRLEANLGQRARHFAFPYGRSADCGPRDYNLARDAGYASAATTQKGFMRTGQDPFSLPRNSLNGAHKSILRLEAQLAGVVAAAARVLGRV